MKTKTYLPAFPGFYNTLYQFDDEEFICSENEEREENDQIEYDDLDIDYDQYENDISIEACKVIGNQLKDFVTSIEFESLYSPKQYNYSNDSINCVIDAKMEKIKSYIYANKDYFSEYLKNKYTSYDGFISAYDNNFDGWRDNTKDFTQYNQHELGSILEFIYSTLDIDAIDTYYEIKDCIYEGNYITINKKQGSSLK